MSDRIAGTEGMLYHIVKKRRPELARRIQDTDQLETLIIGLGGQGAKHAGLMKDFGTRIAAGVAPGKSGRIHPDIPVYSSVREALAKHPDAVAASVWRHYSTAPEAAVEAIEAGIPIVVLITEGIPLRDVRDIICAARKHDTLLVGGNTPGLIFPPERIKIGMLPDVFFPEIRKDGSVGSRGVTIVSRSGAILYHLSDAMASVGIAQNAVIGVGGDGAIGSVFRDLVPMAMEFPGTDLVIVAGEIGGCQEERLAEDMQVHPERYPKKVVALLSGARAPEGKTMGHAGAIITPGRETGTYLSKKKALEAAGVKVVNSQYDLIDAVQAELKGKVYFQPDLYYRKMKAVWEAPPPRPSWPTMITEVKPNHLLIRGFPLQELIGKAGLLQSAFLIAEGRLPDQRQLRRLEKIAAEASSGPVPRLKTEADEDVSKTFMKCLLADSGLANFQSKGEAYRGERTVYTLGRMLAYTAAVLKNEAIPGRMDPAAGFHQRIYRVITGRRESSSARARVPEAMILASIDHGVTPPSAQATRIAASVRASFEVALAQGVGAITDVHGGAGEKAARFFLDCVELSRSRSIPVEEAARIRIREAVNQGRRIEGIGHRIHTRDPRRDALWETAEMAGVAGDCVALSKIITKVLGEVRGLDLPVNVDGVIGAVVGDMGLDPRLAKVLFVFGRVCGLSAHYFEEIETQPPMRRIRFEEAVYKGHEAVSFPDSESIINSRFNRKG